MSTLKANNIQHLDASSASIQVNSVAGTVLTGVSTCSNGLNVTSGNVGIGTETPLGNLHVQSGLATVSSVQSSGSQLVLEDNTNAGLTILSGNTSLGAILFGDSEDNDAGRIRYEHSNNQFSINVGDRNGAQVSQQIMSWFGANEGEASINIHGGPTTVSAIGQTIGSLNYISRDASVNDNNTGSIAAKIETFNESSNGALVGLKVHTFNQTLTNGERLREVMRLTSAGRVGIGSTIPRADLDVPNGAATRLLLADNVTASGTEDDVTGIPAWATKITILFNSLSQSGTNNYLIQLGTSASFITSNYDSASANSGNSSNAKNQTGFVIVNTTASHHTSGIMTIEKVSDSVYVEQHSMCIVDNTQSRQGAGICRSISDAITRLRITNTASGTFDNGTFTVYVE